MSTPDRPIPPVFELRGVCYAYDGGQTALDGVDLTIAGGDSCVILGANGSGKSTLLKLMDALYFPSAGTISAFSMPLTQEAFRDDEYNFAFRRRVGFVFQDSDVQLFSPSVQEEVAFAPLQLGFSHREVDERVGAALAELRIEDLRERAPHRLSGGEKRRVALASILTLEPEVWLLDEPTTGLDPRTQSWLTEFILTQRQRGKTVITATHDLTLAEAAATTVHVFSEEHTIVASGTPSEILGDHELMHRCNLFHYHPRSPEAPSH